MIRKPYLLAVQENCVVAATRKTSCSLSAFNNPKLSDFVVHGPSGKPYYCSKFLLSSGSTKFAEMFEQADKSVDGQGMHIQAGNPQALESVLYFLHLGQCDLENETFLSVLSMACEYGVDKLIAECVSFEQNRLDINLGNCFMILLEAVKHQRQELVVRCESFITKRIEFVTARPEFLSLPYHIIKGLLSSAVLQFDDHKLEFSCLDHIITGICGWIHNSGENRKVALAILEGIPFGICTQQEIGALLSSNAVKQTPEILSFIAEEISASCMGSLVVAQGLLLKSFASESPDALIPRATSWKKWIAPSTGWFYIVAKGGKGLDYLRTNPKNATGNQTKTVIEGGCGVVLGGSLFLNEGDKLKVITGKTVSGGGSSCVVVLPKRPGFQPVLFAVAAGGGGAGSAKPGKPGESNVGLPVNELLISPPDEPQQGETAPSFFGNQCGPQTANCKDVFALSGSCSWCDGGKGGTKKMIAAKTGGGGSGFYGGMGDMLRGGTGGQSFISISAVNVIAYKGCTSNSGLSIFSGRDVPKGCLSP